MSDQERREECRREVRGFLAERQALAFTGKTIHRRLRIENDFTIEEVKAAAVFLVGAGQAKVLPDPEGATPFYQATSEGVLAHERRFA